MEVLKGVAKLQSAPSADNPRYATGPPIPIDFLLTFARAGMKS